MKKNSLIVILWMTAAAAHGAPAAELWDIWDRHDATSTTDGGRTLHWEFLLRKHTRSPMSLAMKAPLPIPWWIWFSGGLIVFLFLLLVIWAAKYTIARRA